MDQTILVTILGSWSQVPGPLYRLLTQALRKAILDGDLPAGTRLPAERVLAKALVVSRNTVVAAYSALEQEALLKRQHGSGTWVQALPYEKAIQYRPTANGSLARSPLFETLLHEPQDCIDLSTGMPGALNGLSLDAFALPPDELASLLTTTGYAPLGLPALRQAIARYLSHEGLPTRADEILVTSGAQQAISLVATLYVQRGDTVILENPTYFGALDTFRALGARLLPVPVDHEGLRVDMLRRVLETCLPRLLYLAPTYHNPTGTVLSPARRHAIAALAKAFAFPIVEDNAFADLAILGEAPPPIASVAVHDAVLTIGSLNKLYWQGLRIGWLRAPEALIARLGRLKLITDLGTGSLAQGVAVRLLERMGEMKVVRQQELRCRLDLVTQLLHNYLPTWTWRPPDGGYFLWIQLPSGDASAFAQLALRCGVVVTPGTVMSVDESHQQFLRLPFLVTAETLRQGVQRLAAAWDVYTRLPRAETALMRVIV